MHDDSRALTAPAMAPPAAPTADDRAGILWWNSLTETARARWLTQAGSARPVDAWSAFKRSREPADGIGTGADVP